MDTLGFGHHLILDQQRTVRRAGARERLSVEEQAAYGLPAGDPARVRAEQGWGRSKFASVVASAVARLWRSGVERSDVEGHDEAGASQPM